MAARDREQTSVPIGDRVGLRIEEAAAMIGISKRAFQDHLLARCPKISVGRAIIIPRKPFDAFILSLTEEESEAITQTAEELLEDLEDETR